MNSATFKKKRVAEIRERLNRATPGPWVRWVEHSAVYCGNEGRENEPGIIGGNCIAECNPDDLPEFDGDLADDEDSYQIQADNNADFIAHAPEDIEYLLSRLEPQERRLDVEGIAAEIVGIIEGPNHAKQCGTCRERTSKIAELLRKHLGATPESGSDEGSNTNS